MNTPDIQIEKFSVKAPTRRLGHRIVLKKGWRKYVCFVPIQWKLETADEVRVFISQEAVDWIAEELTRQVEASRNEQEELCTR